MTVLEILKQSYTEKVSPLVREKSVSVGSTPVLLLQHNPSRYSVTISNKGATNVTIGLSPLVTVLRGILCQANGGSISIGADSDLLLPTQEFWAVSDGANVDLYCITVDLS
jgi:hypothetical protein